MITSTNLSMLRNLEHFQVMSNILAYLKAENLEELKLTTQSEAFEKALKTYDDVLVLERGNALSEKINQADLDRDLALRSLLSAVKNYVSFPNAEKAAAANQLLRQIEKYGKRIDKLPYLQESGVLNNLLQDLEIKENTDYLKLLHLEDWVSILKEAAGRFNELFQNRESDNSTKLSGQVKEARQAIQAEFEQLTTVLNAYEIVYGTTLYGTLIAKINEAVEYAQTQTTRRNSRTKTESPTE